MLTYSHICEYKKVILKRQDEFDKGFSAFAHTVDTYTRNHNKLDENFDISDINDYNSKKRKTKINKNNYDRDTNNDKNYDYNDNDNKTINNRNSNIIKNNKKHDILNKITTKKLSNNAAEKGVSTKKAESNFIIDWLSIASSKGSAIGVNDNNNYDNYNNDNHHSNNNNHNNGINKYIDDNNYTNKNYNDNNNTNNKNKIKNGNIRNENFSRIYDLGHKKYDENYLKKKSKKKLISLSESLPSFPHRNTETDEFPNIQGTYICIIFMHVFV